jgi:hypothetical protein
MKTTPIRPAIVPPLTSRSIPGVPTTATVRFETLTPELAAALLSRNPKNRPINSTRVAKLAQEATEGLWTFHGADTICTDTDGNLLNGQNRCKMVTLTGLSIPVILVEGLPASVQIYQDVGGLKRTVAQQLGLLGYQKNSMLAATLRQLGMIRAWESRGGIVLAGQFTVSDALASIKANPGICDSVEFLSHHRCRTANINVPLSAALHYHMAESSNVARSYADEYFTELHDIDKGNRASHSGAALAAWTWFYNRQKVGGPKGGGFAVDHMSAAILTKGWNCFVAGAEPSSLSFRAGGTNRERFPLAVVPAE